ncbi:RNA-binding protein 5 isoform X2 [Ambystoma mexicanum]|uniref:RNA-binding protein 5 isoform X2 n=1 Tax=Ambystoma mexicanum TaxID=8296 RepID=UPI0037E9A0C0
MGSDKRLSRSERSGRYGSSFDRDGRDYRDDREYRSRRRESDYRRSSDDRRSERYDDYREYDSPEGGRNYSRAYESEDILTEGPFLQRDRVRRNSDRSEDGYHSDGDYAEHDYRHDLGEERESKTIMLRGLPITVTDYYIRELVETFEGPQPADVRLMKRKTGVSRGFAFVEFYDLQDATSWMEANQNNLVMQGKNITMHYSNPRPKFEDWLCNKCLLYNFRRRLKCFRCGAPKSDCEQDAPSGAPEMMQSVDFYSDTIILRNIAPHTVVESIMTALSPYATLAVGNIRLIKDKQTQQNRGFAFVQLASTVEASQLLQTLQFLHPPLKIDGKTIGVDFAKSARKHLVLPDGNRVTAFSVASTAIAAAQWSSTQAQGEGADSNYQEGIAQYGQDYQQYYPSDGDASTSTGLGSSTITTSVVVSQSPQLYNQPGSPPQACTSTSDTTATTSICTTSTATATPAITTDETSTSSSTQAASSPSGIIPGNTYAVPDTSTYHYDESSGYYYDPNTGLYYDPNSQYYYNSLTLQYLYWDGEKQTYLPASESAQQQQQQQPNSMSANTKEGKEKKEKPKSKTAQQIAKDMERWAKSLNKQKENFKNFSTLTSKDEERRESAAADAGFALFEKKGAQSERQLTMPEMTMLIQNGEEENPLKLGLVAAYSGDSDNEEEQERLVDIDEDRWTDLKKMACLLCRRQFPNRDALTRHQQLSDLHKQNLELFKTSKLSEQDMESLEQREREMKYRDRAAERREKYGIPEPPEPKRKKHFDNSTVNYEQPTKDGLDTSNIGNKMLQAMGWKEGLGLGKKAQGITAPIQAKVRMRGAGLGAKGSSYGVSTSESYKDAVRKAMLARFTEME